MLGHERACPGMRGSRSVHGAWTEPARCVHGTTCTDVPGHARACVAHRACTVRARYVRGDARVRGACTVTPARGTERSRSVLGHAGSFGGDNHWCLGSLCFCFTPCVCGNARNLVVPDPYSGVRTVTAGPSTLCTQNVDDVVTTTGVMNPAS